MRHGPHWDHATYLKDVIRTGRLRRTAEKAMKILSRWDFDSIAFQGMSGALIASILAVKLNKTMILVRKEKTHSRHRVEGDSGARKYIIVDDFIETGRTIKTVFKQVSNFAPRAKCVGVYFTDAPKEGVVPYDSIMKELRDNQ